jgi:putative ABC transport system permease protein
VRRFDVSERTREIGVRGALGASRGTIVRAVLRHALLVVAGGSLAGVAIALLFAPRLEALLFQVPARDPLTVTAVVATLLLVGIAASALPAWRAARVPPAGALRE